MTDQRPTREWRIRIRHADRDNKRRCLVDIDFGDGTYQECRNIPCELPPEFADFLKPATGAQPQRRWRLAPDRLTALGDEGIMFGAGDLATLRSIGERLHNALFDFPNNDLSGVLVALSGDQRVRVALEIEPGSPLERVPWEAMYSPRLRRFLATNVQTNLVRLHDPIVRPALPDPIDGPIRILVAVANPALDLDTDLEVSSILRRFDELVPGPQRPKFELVLLEGVNRTTFKSALRRNPHIIHFIGHGDFNEREDQGLLQFHHERNPKKVDPITADQLRSILQNYRPWMVVLNSCFSAKASKADPFGGAAQSLIGLGVPFVVAMQYPISDDAAVAFSQSFYASIAENGAVTDAVSQARNEIETLGDEEVRPELITPVLYLSTTGSIDRIAIAPALALAPAGPSAPAPRRARTLAWLALGVLSAIIAALAIWFVSERMGSIATESSIQDPIGTPSAGRSPTSTGASSGASAAITRDATGSAGGNYASRTPMPGETPTFIPMSPPLTPEPLQPGAAPPPPDGGVPFDPVPLPPGPSVPDTQVGFPPDGGPDNDIIMTGMRRSSRVDLFLGGALGSSRPARAGFSAAIGANARIGGWSLRAQGNADILGGIARRQRLGAEIAVQHSLGEDGAYLRGRLAYSRQDVNGIDARGTAGVSLGYQSNLGNLRWRLEAGPVVRRTRLTNTATSSEVAASSEANLELPVTYNLGVRLGAGAVVGKTASGHVAGAAELRLTRDLAAETSVDIDLEDQRVPEAHRSAVTVRAGLRYRF